jgi:hypothetical protein
MKVSLKEYHSDVKNLIRLSNKYPNLEIRVDTDLYEKALELHRELSYFEHAVACARTTVGHLPPELQGLVWDSVKELKSRAEDLRVRWETKEWPVKSYS